MNYFRSSIRRLANYSKSKPFFSHKDDLVICKSFLEKGLLDEPALAEELGRKPQNILLRWMYQIIPTMKKNNDLGSNEFAEELKRKIHELENTVDYKNHRFTKVEDEKILRLVEKYGTDWHLISREMRPRSAHSIYCRYNSCLKPDVQGYKIPFTKEEDDIIKNFMETVGKTIRNKWSYLSKVYLPNRPASLLRLRWRVINSDSTPFTLDDYKLFLKGLHNFGPEFHQISKEIFPNKHPISLRNFWVHGLRNFVPEFYTFKWTRRMDQKLINSCVDKGFDTESVMVDFPKIYDKAEIRYRMTYLFKFVPPNQKSIPFFPFDSVFENIRASTTDEHYLEKIREKLDSKFKIPKQLLITRTIACNRKTARPFSPQQDSELIEIIKKALEKDPFGNFGHAKPPLPQNPHRVILETIDVMTWNEIGKKLNRGPKDCMNRWFQLKYDVYH